VPLYLHGNEPRIERVEEMSKPLPIVFASNEVDDMEKVLRVLSLRINFNHMDARETEEFDTALDGMRVKGYVAKINNFFSIGVTESDIDELIGDYISDKAGVPFYDMSKRGDQKQVNNMISQAIPFGGSHIIPQMAQQPAQKKRTSPTQKKLDTVLKAMPNDNFVQSLDQQYQRRGRLTPKQQSALQKIYDRVTNPSSVQIDPNMKARLDALVKAMPRDRFVKSLSDQYSQRGSLSTKQISAIEKLEKGIASGGDKALIQRIDALLANTVKIKGRRKSLLTSFKEQVTNGRKLSQRQLELLSEYEQL